MVLVISVELAGSIHFCAVVLNQDNLERQTTENYSSTNNMGACDRVCFRSNRRDILILSATLERPPLVPFESNPHCQFLAAIGSITV